MDNDLYNDLTEAYWDNDIRPFYGDHDRSVGGRLAPALRPTGQRTGTVEQLWEQRIEAGECPRGFCAGVLDDGCCKLCGWSLTEHRMRGRLSSVADKPDYVPRLPELFDEYSPAQVDEAA